MTNYNKRLDKIVRNAYSGEVSWIHDQLDGTSFIEEELGRVDKDITNTKQALSSLIKELVAEAKPKTTPFDNNLDGGYATDIRNSAIDEFEQSLLKALEEV